MVRATRGLEGNFLYHLGLGVPPQSLILTPSVVSQESCNAALNLSWECHTLAQGCRWDLCVLHSHVRTPPHRQCREAEVVVERERMGVKELDAPANGMANKSNGNGFSLGFSQIWSACAVPSVSGVSSGVAAAAARR